MPDATAISETERDAMTTTKRAVVIGGGISGLACAGVLCDAGFRITVFDKGRGVGGRTSTRRESDWRFDHGAPRADRSP
jgi:predicted NAD/FAD-dependent oxidoreductase